jgi:hypothetical protein
VTERHPTNLAASVRQRLLNLARERGDEFQLILMRYGVERLLYRLGQSPHADAFVLKGAVLFQMWTGQPHRSTLDVDFLATGTENAVARTSRSSVRSATSPWSPTASSSTRRPSEARRSGRSSVTTASASI